MKRPLLLPHTKNLLTNPLGKIHPLLQNKSLNLAAWMVTGIDCHRKEFQKKLPDLSLRVEENHQRLVTHRPGISELAGVIGKKLIHFNVL